MRTSSKTQPTIRLHEVKTQGRRIHLGHVAAIDRQRTPRSQRLEQTLAQSRCLGQAEVRIEGDRG